MKTVVFVGDTHCGSVFGLTPPGWQNNKKSKYYPIQKETWDAYLSMTREWPAPDILIANGDLIEGRQGKQGGAELITNDRNVQTDMATIALKRWHAKRIFMTYGTSYHTGEEGEDFEYTIAQRLEAHIGGKLFIQIEDMMLDIRHHLGSSSIPHGRATALLRDGMWNLYKAALKDEPKADILVRSHVHYYKFIEEPERVMFSLPSLQLARGRFGSRRCVGEVHWGAVRLTINKDRIVRKDVRIWKLKANKIPVIRVK